MSFTLILQTLYSTTLHPPCIHLFLILLSFPIPVLSHPYIWASHGPWSLAPVLQFSWSSSQKPTYLWPTVLGAPLGLSLFCPGINEPLSCPLTPDLRDCCFKITLLGLSKAKFCLSGPTQDLLCPYLHCHTHRHHQECHRKPMGAGPLLMRDADKELPPGAVKAASGHSREQELDFQGTSGAWLVPCTHP